LAQVRICLSAFLLIGVASVRIHAEVASVFLDDMNSRAFFVGLVHEDRVSQISSMWKSLSDKFPRFPLFWRTTAFASVKEVWKGARYKQIEYRASPAWVCDASKAAVGTDAVVFLDKAQLYGLEIAWDGYGRYPLIKEGSSYYIDIGDARLPPELAARIIPAAQNERLLALDILRTWCRSHSR
jgi:hypothetical protein